MTDLTTSAIERVLRNNYLGHLAYLWQGKPHVIPITYYFDPTDNTIISYTSEGHKIDAMRANKSVAVQVEQVQSISNWESVMLQGTFEEIRGSSAKQKLHLFTEGVKDIIRRKENREVGFINEFSSKSSANGIPVVFQIKILEMSGKRRKK
jgi:nitroimidazol reductase NimA-like FMN-containing flavoprotein (pyridoxamine 5'-phosphate oxidase superfamily)